MSAMELLSLLDELTLEVMYSLEKLLRESRFHKVVGKGASGDKTLAFDKAVEEKILSRITREYPDATVISEEVGVIGSGGPPFFVIDPVDGSANAERGVPFYACSIAVSSSRQLSGVQLAVIRDLTRGTLYHAVAGFGAYRDGVKISTRNHGGSSLYFSVYLVSRRSRYARMLNPQVGASIRAFGSIALELAMLAEGRIDVVADLRGVARPVDIAAGSLIVREAGGIVVDTRGQLLDAPLDPTCRLSFIAAKATHYLRRLKKVLGVQALPDDVTHSTQRVEFGT